MDGEGWIPSEELQIALPAQESWLAATITAVSYWVHDRDTTLMVCLSPCSDENDEGATLLCCSSFPSDCIHCGAISQCQGADHAHHSLWQPLASVHAGGRGADWPGPWPCAAAPWGSGCGNLPAWIPCAEVLGYLQHRERRCLGAGEDKACLSREDDLSGGVFIFGEVPGKLWPSTGKFYPSAETPVGALWLAFGGPQWDVWIYPGPHPACQICCDFHWFLVPSRDRCHLPHCLCPWIQFPDDRQDGLFR